MTQYVDWTYMESKNDPIFTELSTVYGSQRVKELMGFRQDWNREIITHFYTMLTVKIHQPSHEFTFGVGMTFVSYPLVLTPVV
jgi:hypothetical protein